MVRRTRSMRVVAPLVTVLGLLVAMALVLHLSRAAYTAQATNPGNTWSTGSVALADDDSGTAALSLSNAAPGDTASRCVALSYSGSLPAAVSLFASSSSGALAPYVKLVVEEGTGGSFGSCGAFLPLSLDYSGTVAGFAGSATDFASGVGFFVAPASGQQRTYRITATVDLNAPDAVQGASATVDFSWEARSRTLTLPSGFGKNANGQLGDNSVIQRQTPTTFGTATDWIQLSTSNQASCGVRATGALACWGANGSNQLGLGDTAERHVPTTVASSGWASVDMGNNFTCGLKTAGTAWCWGSNTSGRLGVGDTAPRTTPTQVAGGYTDWTSISAGSLTSSCGLRGTGQLWCWGTDGGSTWGTSPVRVGTDSDWSAISVGSYYRCGIRGIAAGGGTLWCWGDNTEGVLGQGDLTNRAGLTQVGTASDWSQIVAANGSVCGIHRDGNLDCWGDNTGGKLGTGDTTRRTSPYRVSGTGWAQVSTGFHATCAIKVDRTLWCWGEADQNGQADGLVHYTPLQVGSGRWWLVTRAGFSTLALPWPTS